MEGGGLSFILLTEITDIRNDFIVFWTYWILQAEYCSADRTTWKLTLQGINTKPKELKTERDCSHRQLFRPRWGSSVWRNNQKALVQNADQILILWVLRVLGQSLNQSARIFCTRAFWLLRHTDEPQRERNSCLWLQSRSVLSSFGVVLMSCRVNFHVVRSALQYSACRI